MIDAIERTLELDASPERVWRALTAPDELSAWFPDEARDLEVRPFTTSLHSSVPGGTETRMSPSAGSTTSSRPGSVRKRPPAASPLDRCGLGLSPPGEWS